MHLKQFLSQEETCATVIPTGMDAALRVPSDGGVDMVLEESTQETAEQARHTHKTCVLGRTAAGRQLLKLCLPKNGWEEGEITKPWC